MDRFLALRSFAEVVDAGSFVAAADRLRLSKAAVSRHVAELEARLGVRLLHRTTRKLSLTEEGEVFHARARELLGAMEEAEAEITSRSREAVGLVRVSVPVSFGIRHLADTWGRSAASTRRSRSTSTCRTAWLTLPTRASTSPCASRACPTPAS